LTGTFGGMGSGYMAGLGGLGEDEGDSDEDEGGRKVNNKDGMGSAGSLHHSSSSPFEEEVCLNFGL